MLENVKPQSCSRCSLRRTPGRLLRRMLASVVAHLQRLTAQIRAVQIEQVEGIEEGRALPTKTKPRRLRGLAVQRTRQRGSGGTEAVRTRLMNVSRASFGKVQSVSGALKSCQ